MPLLRPLPRLGRQSCRQLASSSRDQERETRALLDRIIRSVADMLAMLDYVRSGNISACSFVTMPLYGFSETVFLFSESTMLGSMGQTESMQVTNMVKR